MKRSELLFAILGWRPIGWAVLRLWAFTYRIWHRPEHWAFLELKNRLGWRARRATRLVTGQTLIVDPFERVGREIVRHGCFEPQTVGLIRRLLKPDMVFVDAGAHIGQYSVLASGIVGPGGAVHAFEPDPVTFSYLTENSRLAAANNIRCNASALGEAPGEAKLYLGFADNVATNSLRFSKMHTGTAITVPVTTLDDYAAEVDLKRLDVLKADLEGAELMMLRGGEKTLRRFRPSLVLEFSEWQAAFGYTTADVASLLKDFGYDLYRVDEGLEPYEPRPQEEVQFNIVAFPSGTKPPAL